MKYVDALLIAGRFAAGVLAWRNRRRRSFRWDRQLAVVTGASSGLGAAIAQALLAKGCRVACLDVRPCEWIDAFGTYSDETVTSLHCDVSRADEVNAAAEAVRAHFRAEAPTIFISNAGIMVGKPLLSLAEGEMERTMAVNCFATYHCLRAFLPGMLHVDGGAHVCVTASIMAYVGIGQLSDYVASKHALRGMIDSVRYEVQQRDDVQQGKAQSLHWSMLVLGQLSTPLFARVRMTALGRFLMPVQQPAVVAQDVIWAIESRRQMSYIYRPHLARLAPLMQALPMWLRDAVQRASGADTSMQPPP